MLPDSTTRFVGLSIGLSVRRSVTLYFFCFFLRSLASLWPLPTRTQFGELYTYPALFLVADERLYKRLCPSVGPSVCRSVRHARVENMHFHPCPPVRDWCWPCIWPYFKVWKWKPRGDLSSPLSSYFPELMQLTRDKHFGCNNMRPCFRQFPQ